jgi:hypothetical protein
LIEEWRLAQTVLFCFMEFHLKLKLQARDALMQVRNSSGDIFLLDGRQMFSDEISGQCQYFGARGAEI